MTIKPPFWHPSCVSGYLLDWDGVLADTRLDFSGVRERYYDGRRARLIEDAVHLSESEQRSLMEDLYNLEIDGALRAEPVPGALDFLSILDLKKIPYCVVSRNCMDSIELAAETASIKLPAIVWGRDNGEWMKPDPRILRKAAEQMGVPICECAFVGDFLYDLQGARRTGMRAVLVERIEPEWEEWHDVAYQSVEELCLAMENPEPLVPWEYREIAAKRGNRWLEAAYAMTLVLPDRASPSLDLWAVRAAALAVGKISVPRGAVLTPELWKESPSFDPEHIGVPLLDVIKKFLAPRFPLTSVAEGEEGLKAPRNSLDLTRFIERKIY